METKRTKKYDIVSAGEILLDFISADFAESIAEVENFKRFLGGSPTNLCKNMAWLGNNAVLVATVGQDALGKYIQSHIEHTPVVDYYLETVPQPTTLILVTRTTQDAEFEAYRSADKEIMPHQMPDALLKNTSIFHTTCFALSLEPAQSNIINAAKRAATFGAQLSIDVNYAQKIWNDRTQAQKIITDFCSLGAIIKVSEVDWERIYETPLGNPEVAAKHFMQLGAKAVCVTLGDKGCYGMDDSGDIHFLPTRKVDVKDTTGAGDAFWSGFLTAWLDGHNILNCMKSGRRMAEVKLVKIGQIDEPVDKMHLLEFV